MSLLILRAQSVSPPLGLQPQDAEQGTTKALPRCYQQQRGTYPVGLW